MSLRLSLKFSLVPLIAGLSLFFSSPHIFADSYPSKPITFVVTSSPGGGTDVMARIIAEAMSQDLKVPVIVENVPGAGGVIGANQVARSKPDGYKILFANGGFIVAPLIFVNVGYDPVTHFLGVRQIATVPLVLVVKSDSPYRTLADLVSDAEKGGRISYASLGHGTPSHIVGETVVRNANVQFTHIPYGGSARAFADIQSGAVTFGVLDASYAGPLVQQGVLRAVAVTGQKRLAFLPNTPTLSELGIPFSLVGWYGVFLPAGTHSEVVEKLKLALDKAISRPNIRERIMSSGLGYVDSSSTPAKWTAQYQSEMKQWSGLVKILNISNDK